MVTGGGAQSPVTVKTEGLEKRGAKRWLATQQQAGKPGMNEKEEDQTVASMQLGVNHSG